MKSNVQLCSNIYPVKSDGERIDFTENKDFVRRVWNREALIKLFQYVYHMQPDSRVINKVEYISGLSAWQIRRIKTPDECGLGIPGEKAWGIVIRSGSFEEVCKCDQRDCSSYLMCRPDMGDKNGTQK